MSRSLTEEETRLLGMIQTHYGLQNKAELVNWIDGNNAALWITDASGATVLMVHLTNLASWRLNGTIANDEELQHDWLQIGSI